MRRAVPLALLVLLSLAPVRAGAAPAAPGFRVHLLDSTRVIDSRELMGTRVLVLRFQASYCKPCAKESPAFARLIERYRGHGVEFVAVHVQDTVAATRAFIRANKVTYQVALDPKLAVANRFGFKGSPYTVVVDLKGEMVARIRGESAMNRLPRILDQALKGAPPPRI